MGSTLMRPAFDRFLPLPAQKKRTSELANAMVNILSLRASSAFLSSTRLMSDGVSRRISPSCRSYCGSKSLYFPEAPVSVVDYDTNAIAVKACTKAIKPDVHACARIGIDLSQLMVLRKLGHLVDIQPGPQPARRHKVKTLESGDRGIAPERPSALSRWRKHRALRDRGPQGAVQKHRNRQRARCNCRSFQAVGVAQPVNFLPDSPNWPQ